MSTTAALLRLTEVENAYPNGFKSFLHGCYYFLDQDGDLGYFIERIDGTFESETQYVDFDTLAYNERAECEVIAEYISINS